MVAEDVYILGALHRGCDVETCDRPAVVIFRTGPDDLEVSCASHSVQRIADYALVHESDATADGCDLERVPDS